jgi:hypothetical protein
MTEAIESKSKSKAAPNAFEMPKFELPNFEIPKMEIPAAFRELAEKSVSQAKETYEKMKSAAEEATDVLEGHLRDRDQGRFRLRPQGDRGGAREYQRRVRLRHPDHDREVAVRDGRAVDRPYPQAIRDVHRSIEGTRRDRAESGHGIRRAGEGKLGQGIQEDSPEFVASAGIAPCQARAHRPGFFIAPGARRAPMPAPTLAVAALSKQNGAPRLRALSTIVQL